MTLSPVRLRVDIDGRIRLYSYTAGEWIYVDWAWALATLPIGRPWFLSIEKGGL